jgi:hypothetical protein
MAERRFRREYDIEYDGTAGTLQAVLMEETGQVVRVAQGGRLGVETRVMLSDAERDAVLRRLEVTGTACGASLFGGNQ